jgi:hypothetical protein
MLLSAHALMRLRKRKILPTQVLQVLRGEGMSLSTRIGTSGQLACTLEALVAGTIRVAVALLNEPDGDWLVVITVMN